jgi:hypothetical protein
MAGIGADEAGALRDQQMIACNAVMDKWAGNKTIRLSLTSAGH